MTTAPSLLGAVVKTGMKAVLRFIDSISEWTGKTIRWLCVVLILVLCYEVIMRYVFNSPTIWAMQTSMMIGGAAIAMGWSYVHRHQAHVRVDVIYGRLSTRGQTMVNVVCAFFCFFPFVLVLVYQSASQMLYSWTMKEKMIETAWFPPVFPLRAAVFLGFCLFALQGIAQFFRDVYLLTRNKPYD